MVSTRAVRNPSNLQTLGSLIGGEAPDIEWDWEELISLARRHGMLPLLYWILKNIENGANGGSAADKAWNDAPSELRAEVMADLRQHFYAAAARCMFAEQQLASVLGTLQAMDIAVIVLKGSALGSYYPEPAVRTYGDLDLLVAKEDVDRAEAALNKMGYSSMKSKVWALAHGYDLPMVRQNERLPVELHWKLDYVDRVGSLPVQDVWQRAVSWSVGGCSTKRLEDVDAVLYSCLHALIKHRGQFGFQALCDIAQVVKCWPQERWNTLAGRAVEYGVARPVYLMLVLTEQTMLLFPPQKTLDTLKPLHNASLPDDLFEQLVGSRQAAAHLVPRAAISAGARATILEKSQHFLWNMFLPREGMSDKYNIPVDSPRIWLTYLWRPVDLLRRYGSSAWRALWGDSDARAAWEREAWLERWLVG